MKEDPKSGRMTVSFEELAYSNMLVVEALIQLLVEKGVMTRSEMETRVIKLKSETKVNFTRARPGT
jgi:hypothetical protein